MSGNLERLLREVFSKHLGPYRLLSTQFTLAEVLRIVEFEKSLVLERVLHDAFCVV